MSPGSALDLPGARASALCDWRRQLAKFDLDCQLWNEDGEFRVRLEYSTDLFDAATIERMVGHFQTLLEAVVADPGSASLGACRC